MSNIFYTTWRIALYEAKLLSRSWGFRIFSLLGLACLTVLTVVIGTSASVTPYFMSALSASLPLNSIKLFNVFQGIIAAFLATEFFKRDRRHDTNQVVFTRSFSNIQYTIGKVAGILGVFALLNIAVLLITFVIHFFFSGTVFSVTPYILYPLLISLPTVIFISGASILLITLIRSQAVVFVLMLAYSFLVLVFVGPEMFSLWDSYAFFQPLIYSDFVGSVGLGDFLMVRGIYVFLGFGFIGFSILLSRRLRQSSFPNILVGIFSVLLIFSAVLLGITYVGGKYADLEYRELLRDTSRSVADASTATVTGCNIQLRHGGDSLDATAELELANNTGSSLNSILLSLNPGFKVSEVTCNDEKLRFHREHHLLRVFPMTAFKPEKALKISITYSGSPDERACYLDIPDERWSDAYRLWVYEIPKRSSLVTKNYVLLTPESGWYPVAGLSPGAAFPSPTRRDFVKFSLSVNVSKDMTVISQGASRIEPKTDHAIFLFSPQTPLPQISLTIGEYKQRSIVVDDVVYSLYYLQGHDYFTPYFDELDDEAIAKRIRESKADYEVQMGLDYPYKRLALVEVPIQFYCYDRVWTTAHETVQPQVVLLPEMAALCSGSDFKTMQRFMQYRQRWRDSQPGEKELQENLLNFFIRSTLLNSRNVVGGFMRGGDLRSLFIDNLEPSYEIFPNMVSYHTQIFSSRWPGLNVALEQYIKEYSSVPRSLFRRFQRGLTGDERINLYLNEHSLAELISDSNSDSHRINQALEAKGKQLPALLESNLENPDLDFRAKLGEFIKKNRFQSVPESSFTKFIASLRKKEDNRNQLEHVKNGFFISRIIDSWYKDTGSPGFIFEDIQCYQVIAAVGGSGNKPQKAIDNSGKPQDRKPGNRPERRNRNNSGESQTLTQVKFRVTNPTEIDGIINISFRYRRRFGRRGGGGEQAGEDFSRLITVPAKTTKTVGIVIDQPPGMMSIDTFVSRNIPSVITMPFFNLSEKRDEVPVEMERTEPYRERVNGEGGIYIVDNEDPGFEILNKMKENWLRRNLRQLFGSREEDAYVGLNAFDPPGHWKPAVYQDFYGSFIHSGLLKKAGDGSGRVAWNVELAKTGEYDLYFYYEGESPMMRFMRGRRGGPPTPGGPGGPGDRRRNNPGAGSKKYFLVYHEDGIEEVTVDLKSLEAGWHLIGSYRFPSGKNKVEMTDKNNNPFVTADALKWVKK
jgi:hypothetical protein